MFDINYYWLSEWKETLKSKMNIAVNMLPIVLFFFYSSLFTKYK